MCINCLLEVIEHPLQESVLSGATKTVKPPSEVLLAKFKKYGEVPPESVIKETAKEVCLKLDEVRIWFQHLYQVQKNRMKGAQKRKKTNLKKAIKEPDVEAEAEPEVLCLMCDEIDPPDYSNSDVHWVCCDGCFKWCHTFCCGTSNITEESWLCIQCCTNWTV